MRYRLADEASGAPVEDTSSTLALSGLLCLHRARLSSLNISKQGRGGRVR